MRCIRMMRDKTRQTLALSLFPYPPRTVKRMKPSYRKLRRIPYVVKISCRHQQIPIRCRNHPCYTARALRHLPNMQPATSERSQEPLCTGGSPGSKNHAATLPDWTAPLPRAILRLEEVPAEERVVHPGGMRPARIDLSGCDYRLHRILPALVGMTVLTLHRELAARKTTAADALGHPDGIAVSGLIGQGNANAEGATFLDSLYAPLLCPVHE